MGPEIPHGQNFNRVIEAALGQARCAIVVWSHASVKSEWVFNEASESRRRQILVPVLIDDVAPPLEFRHLQAARLAEWDGDRSDAEWRRLLEAVRTLVQRQSAPPTLATREAPLPAVRRHWWQTPAGAAAGAGGVLAGAALLLMALNQIGLFGGGSTPAGSAAAVEVAAEPARIQPIGPQSSAANTSAPASSGGAGVAPVAAAGDAERVNLLDPAQGGTLVIANQDEWRAVIGAQPVTTTIAVNGFAVFAFSDEKPAIIDAIGVFVESTSTWNVKEVAVSASDGSESGPFRKIGTVTVPNYRNMRGSVHEFPVQPFSARYVKVELLGWQDAVHSSGSVGNLQLLGRLQ